MFLKLSRLYEKVYSWGDIHSKEYGIKKTYSIPLWAVIFSGFIATLLIMVGSIFAGFKPQEDDSLDSITAILSRLEGKEITSLMLLTGIVLFFLSWFMLAPYAGFRWSLLGTVSEESLIRFSYVIGIFFLWALPLIIAMPVHSEDIYFYLAFGKIAASGTDPYTISTSQFFAENDSFRENVSNYWISSFPPYGPVHMEITGLISRIAGDNLFALFLSYRILFLFWLAIFIWCVIRISEYMNLSVPKVLWTTVLSPIFIIHGFNDMHNDMWVVAFFALGILCVLKAMKELEEDGNTRISIIMMCAALVCFSCIAQIKVNLLVYLACASIVYITKLCDTRGYFATFIPFIRSCVYIGIAGVVSIISFAASLSVPFFIFKWDLYQWIINLEVPASIYNWRSFPSYIGMHLWNGYASLFDTENSVLRMESFADFFRKAMVILFVLIIIPLFFDMTNKRINFATALGVVTLFMYITMPVVHPWYLIWVMLPLALWIKRDGFYAFLAIAALFITVTLDMYESFFYSSFFWAAVIFIVIAALGCVMRGIVQGVKRYRVKNRV